MSQALRSGRSSEARLLAARACKGRREARRREVAAEYSRLADGWLGGRDWALPLPLPLPAPPLSLSLPYLDDLDGVAPRRDRPGCWEAPAPASVDLWDGCCSRMELPPQSWDGGGGPFGGGGRGDGGGGGDPCLLEGRRMCCDLRPGTGGHLRLPALGEVGLRLGFGGGGKEEEEEENIPALDLQQDGPLRPYNPSTVLWPGGYLLAQCLGPGRVPGPGDEVAPSPHCGGLVPEIREAAGWARGSGRGRPVAVELGSGVGAASAALALSLGRDLPPGAGAGAGAGTGTDLPLVVATDLAPEALSLAETNGLAALAALAERRGEEAAAPASLLVRPELADCTNATALGELRRRWHGDGDGDGDGDGRAETGGGFALVLAASVPPLLLPGADGEGPPPLWAALDALLDRANPHAVALVAHVASDPVTEVPVGQEARGYELVRTVAGDAFGMATRWGEPSDFAISVLRRRRKPSSSGSCRGLEGGGTCGPKEG